MTSQVGATYLKICRRVVRIHWYVQCFSSLLCSEVMVAPKFTGHYSGRRGRTLIKDVFAHTNLSYTDVIFNMCDAVTIFKPWSLLGWPTFLYKPWFLKQPRWTIAAVNWLCCRCCLHPPPPCNWTKVTCDPTAQLNFFKSLFEIFALQFFTH